MIERAQGTPIVSSFGEKVSSYGDRAVWAMEHGRDPTRKEEYEYHMDTSHPRLMETDCISRDRFLSDRIVSPSSFRPPELLGPGDTARIW